MALPLSNTLTEPATLSRTELSLRRREIVDRQKWAWFKHIGWNPHRYQIRMHLSGARNRYSIAGRRGGKTAWASKEASAYMVAGPYRVWLCGPDYDAVYMEFRNILQDLQSPANPHRIIKLSNNPQGGDLIIRLSNGAEVVGKSLNQTTKSPKVGEEIDLLILCEGSNISHLGGEGGLWETQLEGNLGSRLGDMIIPTTASGKDNFLFPRVTLALTGKNPDEFTLKWPSWANPTWLEDPVELAKRMSRRAFREQYCGEFVSWSGTIWIEDCGFEEEQHTILPFKIPSWWNRYEIIDPGFSDYYAWIAAVTSPDNTLYIVDEFRAKRTLYIDLANEIIRRRIAMYGEDEYHHSLVPNRIPIYVDPEDPRCREEIMAAARSMGETLSCMPADNSVWSGFEAGSTNFRTDREYVFNSCANSINALRYHEWANNKNTKGQKVEKRDEYKHFSDIIRYLQLVNYRASVKPKPERNVYLPTYQDLYNSVEQNKSNLFGSDMGYFRKEHAA